MSTSSKDTYHHGELRNALLTTAMQLLEAGEPLSLREVARRTGVSPTAPYRHYADKDALESALATEGFRDLRARLVAASPEPATPAALADLAVAYVRFALERPAMFRLMFGNECDDSNDQRVVAASSIRRFLSDAVGRVFPEADGPALAVASWSLVHGLAFLHLDGKLAAATPNEVDLRVRTSIKAILTVRGQ
ncbi:TetR/AcrR family transcriptional regulator [Brooklawnia cerclae]|uniref:AcrR family transcriptional regulator n=1 Tax=Brooklawnia cerclae TaxID=349934 RepID=A0ABX0SGU0_9ACTN|nr:AcrR family transcriptional regulator [Brooklawnia cerclae]